ncbi:MAG: hypothetical protein FWF56_04755 [Firmicutes bacterium]|nr:hypothetical protein [Bacillota bacterium]MCL1953771.1 hypothetical protein [Bacillota bacterium]
MEIDTYNSCNNCNIQVSSHHTVCPICRATVYKNNGEETIYSYTIVQNNLTFKSNKSYTSFKNGIVSLCVLCFLNVLLLVWDNLDIGGLWVFWVLVVVLVLGNALYSFSSHKIWHWLVVAMIVSFMISILIDLQDGRLSWSMSWALSLDIVSCSIIFWCMVFVFDIVNTNTVSFAILFASFGVAIQLLSLLQVWVFGMDIVKELNIIYLVIQSFILLYFLIFKLKNIKVSLHAKLHV